MTKNLYKVPQKQWRKWSEQARAIFNRCYSFYHDNFDVLVHPDTVMLPSAEWKTLSWNAAWIAADACDNTIPDALAIV